MKQSEVVKMWKEAMLSGEYVQIRGPMKDENGFCAMGVLWDVLAKAGVLDIYDNGWPKTDMTAGDFLGVSDTYTYDIVYMNDKQGKTFEEICEYIDSLEKTDVEINLELV